MKSFLGDVSPPKKNTGSAPVNNELLAVKLSHLPLKIGSQMRLNLKSRK